ncbi:MAG: hypothetical protein RBR05_02670 [Candidatus Methanomethylophilaceae archaeon]|nr:hypothetical protein [Candidatus Methanomethylophilaceae archaeon]MDD3379272.1 hypothetical protein [Candidatus Methanomethylophilaceae archaeon]MDY0224290.1 hypothetical protein [Candidatus Methanomethylophilaceae archaeon]
MSDYDVLNHIYQKYGTNEPIFAKDLTMIGRSSGYMRQSLTRLAEQKKIVRYSQGIYFIPKESVYGKKFPLDLNKIVKRKYISEKKEVYGFYAGTYFKNSIGLTEEPPSVIEIVTNRESTRGRVVCFGDQQVRIRCPVITIDRDNAKMLQFLDLMNRMGREEASSLNKDPDLKKYLKKAGFARSDIMEYADLYPAKTLTNMVKCNVFKYFD